MTKSTKTTTKARTTAKTPPSKPAKAKTPPTSGTKAKTPDATPQRPTKRPKAKPKTGGEAEQPKQPGVIAVIIQELTNATAKQPLTKAVLLDRLAQQFPEREPDAMKKTINAQIGHHLRVKKGLDVKKNDKGYWLN